jgi:hypothetical protein
MSQEQIKNQFEALHHNSTNRCFICRVKAKKTTKGLENLEKSALRAQKRKLAERLERVTDLQNELFQIKACRTTN